MNKAETNWAVFRTTVAKAIQEGDVLLRRLLPETAERIATSLQQASNQASPLPRQASVLLEANRQHWTQAFPAYLLEAFSEVVEFDPYGSGEDISSGLGGLSFSDDLNIQAKSEISHFLRTLESALESPINDLDGLVSAARGYAYIRPSRNPMRPENYVMALQKMVYAKPAGANVQQYLLKQLITGLPPLLTRSYQLATLLLSEAGIDAVQRRSTGFGALSTGFGSIAPFAGHADAEDRLLTKDELLATLNNDPKYELSTFHAPASKVATGPATNLSTGSLEMDVKWDSSAAGALAPENAQQHARKEDAQAPTFDQLIARIGRATAHLLPLKEFAAKLQPSLRSLVQNDPAFLRSADHPARQLIAGIEAHARAFKSTGDAGFDTFEQVIKQIGNYLHRSNPQNAVPFARALEAFNKYRNTYAAAPQPASATAAKPLSKSEKYKRNSELLLARVIAHIEQLPDYPAAHPRVQKFATEPWAKVIVKTRLRNAQDEPGAELATADPQGYLALVPLLLSSVQAEKLHHPDANLLGSIKQMWETIGQGLSSVGLDEARVEAAVTKLKQLHKIAIEEASAESSQLTGVDIFHASSVGGPIDLGRITSQDAVSANQRKAITLPKLTETLEPASSNGNGAAPGTESFQNLLRIGSWFKLGRHSDALKSKLSWVSDDKTIFMFTAEDGSSQTMTRRRLLQLFESGDLNALR